MDIIKITFCVEPYVAQWNRQRALVLLRQKISEQIMRRAKLLVAIHWVMNRTSQVHRRMKTLAKSRTNKLVALFVAVTFSLETLEWQLNLKNHDH